MSLAKRRELKSTGCGVVGKEAVAGIKDRETNKVVACHMQKTDTPHVAGFSPKRPSWARRSILIAAVYNALKPFSEHESVNHSVTEYVREQAHKNGMESFWSMMKRGNDGIYQEMSPKHLEK